MAERSFLRSLADYVGILPEYLDARGALQVISDQTREAILAAMGYDASTEESAGRILTELQRKERDRLISPVQVVRRMDATPITLDVNIPAGATGKFDWMVDITTEDGGCHRTAGTYHSEHFPDVFSITLSESLPVGYHHLKIALRNSHSHWMAEQLLIIAPVRVLTVAEVLGNRKAFGICANLYTIRSENNWGIGDLSDLGVLCRWSAQQGAAFVGINPLHALRNRRYDVSPYSPVSRLFRNPIYLDVTRVPELTESLTARKVMESPELIETLHHVRSTDRVDYDLVMNAKMRVLRELFRSFYNRHYGKGTERGNVFDDFLQRQGGELMDFATFLSLESHIGDTPGGDSDWRHWPEVYRNARSKEVDEFRRRHQVDVNFHCYVQFELERQLLEVTRTAQAVGMPIGIYEDLAVGSDPSGSDAWAFSHLFVSGVNQGAPPDDYSATGQDWGFSPINPHRLRQDRYRYWIHLLRRAMAPAGALRIDHVMGLWRQYWIPHGMGGGAGAYVAYPAEDLLGILALESRRNRAVVIGEDLGTVPPGLSEVMERWGILSSRVLYFQRKADGRFLRANEYCNRALVTTTTHDHPPLAGFWQGTDLRIRRSVGSLATDEELNAAEEQRDADRRALFELLASEGLLPQTETPVDFVSLCRAVHAFLSRTPAPLLGVMLDDVAGEVEPVNLPGIDPSRHPNWSRRMMKTLEELSIEPDVLRILRSLSDRSIMPSSGGNDGQHRRSRDS